jgi:hypothetical protein
MAFLDTLKKKLQTFNKKVDDYQETVTFAEAGVHHLIAKPEVLECAESSDRNLVVASYESRFSDDLVAYALEMAQRMDFGIIAVNAANLTHDVTEFFSTTHEALFNDFKEASTRNVQAFRTRAVELDLKFTHTIKFSSIDHAIDDITKKCGEIEFIISENREQARTRGVVKNENRIAQRLCIYSMN